MAIKEFTLTGNDLALAQEGLSLAIAWSKKNQKGSGLGKERRSSYSELIKRLDAISQQAYPYDYDCMPSDCGDDKIMTINRPVVRETRKVARMANRRGPA
jgi:hypothetical protein